MRNMSMGLAAFVVSVGMVSVGAQGRNFSGTWIIDSERTMAEMRSAMGEMAGAVVARSGGGGGRGGAVGGTVSGTGTGTGGGVAVGGTAVARSGGGGGVASAGGGGGGGRGGAAVSADTVIAIDGTTFSIDAGGTETSYPLNGSEITVPLRGGEAKARASWKGDTLVITQTIDSPNGPVTSTTSWSLEGDSLVRETTRKTYYKRK